jgi:acetyl esterase/lipase
VYLQSHGSAILRAFPWKPRGWLAWLWAGVACVAAAWIGMLGLAMVLPVHWDGPGKYAQFALFFPLHLLVATPFLAGLGYAAARCRAALAAAVFGLLTLVVLLLALIPVFSLWWAARAWNAPLSLADYLENARHWNVGLPVPERSVGYGVAPDGTKLELDVWGTGRGRSGPLRPAVVLVHGGAWTKGNRSSLPGWNRWLNSLGYEVFDVEYRLPPPARFRDEVADVKAAIGFIAANAPEYHVDPTRISMMGGSAGANLALLAAYSMGDPRLPASTSVEPVAVRSVINLYGPTDLELIHRTASNPDYVRANLEEYIGGAPADFPDRYRLVSPLSHAGPKSPPTLTLTGASDRLVPAEHALRLDRALAQVGATHELYVLPATDHAFDVNWGGFATQIARAKIADFLARHGGR